ncbi:MAG: glycosyltransferase family 2 protein [Dermatophilaceae bacterium]
MNGVRLALTVFGLLVLAAAVAKLVYVPLAAIFEIRDRRLRARPAPDHEGSGEAWRPTVSVMVPGYNEEKVIDACVTSIASCGYPDLEIVLVDDGSTDSTFELMTALERRYPTVSAMTQPNAGKGNALNTGLARATGQVVLFVDADSVFTGETIPELIAPLEDPRVGAVCGDDRPVNLDRVQTRFLALISHVGTGLVRRALHMIGCVPVVSGNVGAFRRTVLDEVGPVRSDTVGEDLELTWRIHESGYRIAFAPWAIVYAESPSTLRGLWKQRVRWARGLLQSLHLHRGSIANPRYGVFGAYLVYTVLSMVLVPVLQLLFLAALPWLLAIGLVDLDTGVWPMLSWLGMGLSTVMALIALGLDRAWRDLRFLWALPLWPLYSVFTSATMVRALDQVLRRQPARWNKLDRTGVRSLQAVPGSA